MNDVLGLAKNNIMHLMTSPATYALECKEMGGGMPFPGSEVLFTRLKILTNAALHAYFSIWDTLTPPCGNRSFKFIDGGDDVES